MQGVKLSFDDKTVLKGVDLSLEHKETLVVMGKSGGGKSTLLRLIMGLLMADEGSIRFKDREITRLPRPEMNRLRATFGMVFQNAALIGSITVARNLAFPLEELSDKTREEIAAIVAAKLELVGLKDAGEKLPSELSGGMRKRVGLARALVLDPELVLFDEPSAGLDPINAEIINDLIIDLRETHHVTSIVVTHEMDSAFRVASRMVLLEDGKITEEGSPEAFRKSENPAVREFLGRHSNHASEAKNANSQK
jgi:phospholipid/cholesterol/gamma-HCH transport system ATP-binding protein